MSIKTCKDIPVGAIITSDKNNTYVCMVDDAGQRGFFTSKGTWYRASETGLAFGKNNTGKIAKIQIFDTLPPLDALSEACKLMWNPARPACATLKTIYTAEDPRVTAAKADIAAAEALIADRKRVIAMYQ